MCPTMKSSSQDRTSFFSIFFFFVEMWLGDLYMEIDCIMTSRILTVCTVYTRYPALEVKSQIKRLTLADGSIDS